MTKIIAFAGRKQSGKTTCAEALRNLYNKSVNNDHAAKIYSFADPLKKNICMDILGLTYDQCYGSDDNKNELTNNYWENKQLTAREVMQFVGTDIFRKMQHNVWVDATIKQIEKESPELAIIADCRFPNEVMSLKNKGGLVIKLMRNPHNSDHESEKALDYNNFDHRKFDIIIFNNELDIPQQLIAIYDFLMKKGILKL